MNTQTTPGTHKRAPCEICGAPSDFHFVGGNYCTEHWEFHNDVGHTSDARKNAVELAINRHTDLCIASRT